MAAQPVTEGFLGTGLSFPLRIEEGELAGAAGPEKIRQSIYAILMTRQGERPLRPDFGSRIWDYVFALPGETVLNRLRNEVVQAVCRWEHRVDEVAADIDVADIARGRLTVTVRYRVRATNRPDNLVFPFFLEEGQW